MVFGRKSPSRLPGATHDHLFLETHRGKPDMGGVYPPAFVLQLRFTTNLPPAITYPDERAQDPQHVHYQALMYDILGIEKLPTGLLSFTFSFEQRLREMQAAHITAYEPFHIFERELAYWPAKAYRPFLDKLIDARTRLVADLIPYRGATPPQRKTVESIKVCWSTPIDLKGDTPLDIIKQMSPDDWHEIARTWNWDHGTEVLDWITSQPTCDRATAVYILCLGNLEQVAETTIDGPPSESEWRFTWELAQRIRSGFFTKRDLDFGVSLRSLDGLKATLARARATGREPWLLSEDLLVSGPRKHRPRYTSRDPRIVWDYDYWQEHIAAR